MYLQALVLLAVSTLLACTHYRSGFADYRGFGEEYRTSGDYSRAPSSELDPLPPTPGFDGQTYRPRAPFQLFWPVRTVRVNRGFRPASDRDHQGVDLGGARGTPILSAHEGLVIYAGRDFRGYGNMVLVEYSREWATLYAHLDRILVREGQILKAGEKLGTMGRTGRATGVHLHFELIHDRRPIDPLPYLMRSQKYASRR